MSSGPSFGYQLSPQVTDAEGMQAAHPDGIEREQAPLQVANHHGNPLPREIVPDHDHDHVDNENRKHYSGSNTGNVYLPRADKRQLKHHESGLRIGSHQKVESDGHTQL